MLGKHVRWGISGDLVLPFPGDLLSIIKVHPRRVFLSTSFLCTRIAFIMHDASSLLAECETVLLANARDRMPGNRCSERGLDGPDGMV